MAGHILHRVHDALHLRTRVALASRVHMLQRSEPREEPGSLKNAFFASFSVPKLLSISNKTASGIPERYMA